MTISLLSSPVREDAPVLVLFSGPADRVVAWSLSGPGTLTPLASATDRNGQAAARYTPAGVGTATISVEYGA